MMEAPGSIIVEALKTLITEFAREGADVVIGYLEQHEDAAETVRLLEAEGRTVLTIAGDIGDESHLLRPGDQGP